MGYGGLARGTGAHAGAGAPAMQFISPFADVWTTRPTELRGYGLFGITDPARSYVGFGAIAAADYAALPPQFLTPDVMAVVNGVNTEIGAELTTLQQVRAELEAAVSALVNRAMNGVSRVYPLAVLFDGQTYRPADVGIDVPGMIAQLLAAGSWVHPSSVNPQYAATVDEVVAQQNATTVDAARQTRQAGGSLPASPAVPSLFAPDANGVTYSDAAPRAGDHTPEEIPIAEPMSPATFATADVGGAAGGFDFTGNAPLLIALGAAAFFAMKKNNNSRRPARSRRRR